MEQQRLRLGEFLIKHGLITEQQLDQALNKQFQTGERLGRVLVGMGVISEKKILSALRIHLGCPMIDLKTKNEIPREVLNLVPYDLAKRSQAIPLSVVRHKNGHELLLAMSNPMDTDLIDDIEFVSGCTVKPVLALDTDISNALTRFYEPSRKTDEIPIDQKDDDDMVIIMGGSEKVISSKPTQESPAHAQAPETEKTPDERLNRLLLRDDAFLDFIRHLLDRKLISINDIIRIIHHIQNSG